MCWKTALRRVLAYTTVAVAAVIVVFNVLPWRAAYWMDISEGNAIIANIEQFRIEHSRLPDENKPDEVTALGFELRTGYQPDYRPMGSEYEIEYYIGFDGPRIIYSSKAKEWRCESC
jgi:hypothetical protein